MIICFILLKSATYRKLSTLRFEGILWNRKQTLTFVRCSSPHPFIIKILISSALLSIIATFSFYVDKLYTHQKNTSQVSMCVLFKLFISMLID